MSAPSEIPDLLVRCEQAGLAPRYGEPLVPVDSRSGDIFVVSDLHLAAGRQSDGTYGGTENFFADSSFRRFLQHAHHSAQPHQALLVINGDFIDFLRVRGVSEANHGLTQQEFRVWQDLLARIGIHRTIPQLQASITKKEKKYGLKTHADKSVWRLDAVVAGHPHFFDALAEWLGHGHRLVIVKGNHDLEWYWLPVRNAMRLALAQRLAAQLNAPLRDVLTNTVLPQVTFVDHSLLVDQVLYIEHGHRYDKFSHVLGAPTLQNGVELNIPFGSFFNRYLLNRIELAYPYLDNVRPRENILPLLIRERFFLALGLLFHHLPFTLKIIPKHYYRYILGRVFWFFLAICVPLAIAGWQVAVHFPIRIEAPSGPFGFVQKYVLDVAKDLAWGFLSYLLARLVAYFQLEEAGALVGPAREIFAENSSYRFVTFGHTHNPDQVEDHDRWFYNTGTWIPIVEISSAEVRHDRTYTFLHLGHDSSGDLQPGFLQRWNDDAGRIEPLLIIRREEKEGWIRRTLRRLRALCRQRGRDGR